MSFTLWIYITDWYLTDCMLRVFSDRLAFGIIRTHNPLRCYPALSVLQLLSASYVVTSALFHPPWERCPLWITIWMWKKLRRCCKLDYRYFRMLFWCNIFSMLWLVFEWQFMLHMIWINRDTTVQKYHWFQGCDRSPVSPDTSDSSQEIKNKAKEVAYK